MTTPSTPEQLQPGPSTHHHLTEDSAARRPAVRSLLIDVVRGMAITLVALGHTNQGVIHRGWWAGSQAGTRLNLAIYAFHMPAFFFITGIFLRASLRKRGTFRFVLDKLRGILWPYVLFSSISALAVVVLARVTIREPTSFHGFLMSLLTGGYGWFLPTIFFALMLSLLGKRLPSPAFFLGAAVLSTWYPFPQVPIVTAAVKLLPFLVLGMWAGRSYERIEGVSRPVAAAGAVLLIVLLFAVTPFIDDVHSSLFYIPLGVTGTLMLLLLARALDRNGFTRTLSWIGEASFGIFLLSAYPQGGTRELLLRAGHVTNPLVQLLVPTLLAVTLPALLYQHRVRLHIAWMFAFPY